MRADGSMLSRAFATVALVAAIVLFAATPAFADHAFSDEAGFTKARYGGGWTEPGRGPRESIRIWKPDNWTVNLNFAVKSWNDKAGWQLFDRVFVKDRADVILKAPPEGQVGAWTECTMADGTFDVAGSYAKCYIVDNDQSHDWDTTVLRHEMGHTLGFADHCYAGDYNRFLEWGFVPKVCNKEDHPAYSSYDGVMSYCWACCGLVNRPLPKVDARMLYRAGYRETAP